MRSPNSLSLLLLFATYALSAPTTSDPQSSNTTNLGAEDFSIACRPLPPNLQPGDPNSCLKILNSLPNKYMTFSKSRPTSSDGAQVPWLLSSQAFQSNNDLLIPTNASSTTIDITSPASAHDRTALQATIDECLLTVKFQPGVPPDYEERWHASEVESQARLGWRECMEGQRGRMVVVKADGGDRRLMFELKAFRQSNPWPSDFGEVGLPAPTGAVALD